MAGISYLGIVKGGVFVPNSPDVYDKRFAVPSMEGKKIVVNVKRFSAPASDDTRAYYFGCVVRVIGEHIEGPEYDPGEIHALLKQRHHNKLISIKRPDGITVDEVVPVSIAGIPQDEMSLYITHIRQWSLNFLGCYVPEPTSNLAREMASSWTK